MTAPSGSFSEYVESYTLESGGTISSHVTEILRDAILDGVFEPGFWLREMKLANDLDVSRTPVRDALRTLAAEGFLSLHANQGAIVSQLTTDDIIELYSVRESLEGLAARLAARRATPQSLEGLDELLTRMRKAGAENRFGDLSAMNLEFHRFVREAAANRYLERSLSQISQAVRRFRHTTYELPGRTEDSLREHEEIAAAIHARDGKLAEKLSMKHISNLAKIRLQMLVDGY
jgi:DNA-binding GntR family transcriptional regulator